MKKHRLLALILAFSMVAAAVAAAAPDDREAGTQPAVVEAEGECSGLNLLTNPSFEGQYSSYVPPDGHPDCPQGICTTAQMAEGWTPWWRSHDPADPGYIIRNPEYKPAESVFTDPPRVRSGDRAQQYFTFFATHEAGFYQRVAATPGVAYCFSIWGHAWSAQDDDDAYSGPEDGLLDQRIGLDPTGGTDWQSNAIVWGAARQQYDIYGLFSLTTTAQADHITVFTYSQPAYAVKHNDVYWDDAQLNPIGLVAPEPVILLSAVTAPGSQSRVVPIELGGTAALTWTAALEAGSSLPPGNLSLDPLTGEAGSDLTLTVDSTGLMTGTYTATITIETNPAVPGSPASFPLTLVVAQQVEVLYLPVIMRP